MRLTVVFLELGVEQTMKMNFSACPKCNGFYLSAVAAEGKKEGCLRCGFVKVRVGA